MPLAGMMKLLAAIASWLVASAYRRRMLALMRGGPAPQDAVAQLGTLLALLDQHQEVECDEASMPAPFHGPWLAWYDSLPDTPCIAICSTSQGDEMCKGCGRSFDEVQRWTEMTPGEKRATWRRITLEGDAWRFNRYAERARGN